MRREKGDSDKMELIVAEHAGFCYGAKRAVGEVYSLLEKGCKIATYGPILHNERLVEELKEKGVRIVNSTDEIASLDKDTVLVIRAHGVTKQVMEEVEKAGIRCVDATCPFVERIHRIAREESGRGKTVFVAGDPDHPEVEGIVSYAGEGARVIRNPEEARDLPPGEGLSICLVAQTTFRNNYFQEIVEILLDRGYNVNVVDTICNATEERQKEAADIASSADAMIVIGGRSSSNTKKLFDICSDRCSRTYFAGDARDLPESFPEGVNIIGVTAGASTPQNTIEEVCSYVRGIF